MPTGPRLVKAEPWPAGRFDDEPPSGADVVTERAPMPTAAELLRARIGLVPPRRAATGLGTLDADTRGGIPEGKVVVIGGAPGSGKTTLAVQQAHDAAKAGWSALVLVADGSTDDALQRIGQLEGLTREEFDENLTEALELVSERLDKLDLRVADTDSCGSLEEASEALKAARGDRPSVLVVDSIQTVRSMASEFADGPRARIDANATALKRCARSDGHLVLATSELARGAYRSKNAADQIDDLAAFKESGALEYAADLAIVLRSVKGEDDLVDVTVPKSRLGARTPFRLQLDRRRMRFGEVAVDHQAEEEGRESAHEAEVEADARTVERFIVEHPGVRGTTDLRAQLRANGFRIANDRLNAAVAKLGDRIEKRGTSNRPQWFVRSSAEGGT